MPSYGQTAKTDGLVPLALYDVPRLPAISTAGLHESGAALARLYRCSEQSALLTLLDRWSNVQAFTDAPLSSTYAES